MINGKIFIFLTATLLTASGCSKSSKSAAGDDKTMNKDGKEKNPEAKKIKISVKNGGKKAVEKVEKPLPLPKIEPGTKAPVDKDAVLRTVSGNLNFTMNFLKLLGDDKSNLFFSPASILYALAMTYNGSSGTEKGEFEKVLGFDSDFEKNSAAVSQMYDYSGVKGKFKLSAANRIFVKDTFKLKEPFLKLNATYFESSVQKLDFARPDNVVKIINEWVEEKTSNLIKKLVSKDHIKPDTKLLLVNAIYMKAEWLQKFEKSSSWNGKFNSAGGKTKVRFMSQTAHFKAGSVSGGSFLEMEYSGRRLSMVIALPDKDVSPIKFLEQTNAEKLNKIIKNLSYRKTSATIPKFSFERSFSLKKTLKKMGMPVSFSDSAKFEKMSDIALKIQDVIHKARIDVDEKGTEAAAATAVIMAETGSAMVREEIYYFTADRPFVFYIRDTKSGHIIFAGIVNSPEYKK